MNKPTNIKELRDDLLDSYAMLKDDPKRVVQVGELANAAGKIISSVKIEMEYSMMRNEVPDIPFLEYNGRNPSKQLSTSSVKLLKKAS